MLGLEGVHVIVNKLPFDALNFGGGLGALIAAGSFGLAAKKETEPGGQG